jgi:hypothetical protein
MEHTIALGTFEADDGGDVFSSWLHKGQDGWALLVGRGEAAWYIDGPHDNVSDAWFAAERLLGKVPQTV